MARPFPTPERRRSAQIRNYEAGDEEAILRAFNQVNGDQDPNFVARTMAAWRWRFLNNPAGHRVTLALDEEGEVLAQYAGSPQKLRLDGLWVNVTQGIDSFSLPDTRGLSHGGSFLQCGEAFARDFGGRTGEGDPWMWGLPVPSARRVGERFLGYVPMRSQPLLELTAGVALAAGPRAEDLGEAPLHAHAHEFQELFLQLAEGPWVLADRRANALEWRYRRHPEHSYRIGAARGDGGELLGIAVWRAGKLEGRRAGLLCDWMCLPEAEGALTRWAVECTRRAGLDHLLHLLPPGCGSFERLQDLGFRVRPSSLVMVGRSFDKAYPTSFWAERWYYTLGDTDLV